MDQKIKNKIKQWQQYAKDKGIGLNDSEFIELKAKTCVKYNGACPCLIHWRLQCPCPECLDEIKEANACYCRVFVEPGAKLDFKKHSEMTKKARIKLGIQKK